MFACLGRSPEELQEVGSFRWRDTVIAAIGQAHLRRCSRVREVNQLASGALGTLAEYSNVCRMLRILQQLWVLGSAFPQHNEPDSLPLVLLRGI